MNPIDLDLRELAEWLAHPPVCFTNDLYLPSTLELECGVQVQELGDSAYQKFFADRSVVLR